MDRGSVLLGLAVGCSLLVVLIPSVGWVAQIGLGVAFVLQFARWRMEHRSPPIDIWLLFLFLLTAAVGLVTAYNPAQAFHKFNVLAAASMLYIVISEQEEMRLNALIAGSIVVGCLLSVYFLAAGDWQRWPADFKLMDEIALSWQALRPDLSLPPIHPNFVGGTLAILLPIPLFDLACSWTKDELRSAVPTLMAALFMAATLAFTSSRGAWIALTAGLLVTLALLAARTSARRSWPWHWVVPSILVVSGLSFLAGHSLLAAFSGNAVETSRTTLFADSFQLARDFFFTGGGLGSFAGLYSRYLLVIPDLFLEYSHNLYLDLWIEQGLLGILAFLLLLLISLLRILRFVAKGRNLNRAGYFGLALLAGSLAFTLHGFIDDPLYGQSGSPLLFALPAGMNYVTRSTRQLAERHRGRTRVRARTVAYGIGLLVLAGVLFMRNSVAASLAANLGAVQMAKAELQGWPQQSDFWDHPSTGTEAVPVLKAALALDPRQAAANYRLGLIALGSGDYDAAVDRLQVAHARRPNHRGVTKSLGYAELWSGNIAAGVELLSVIPESTQELAVYVWWWGDQEQIELEERARLALAFLEAGE